MAVNTTPTSKPSPNEKTLRMSKKLPVRDRIILVTSQDAMDILHVSEKLQNMGGEAFTGFGAIKLHFYKKISIKDYITHRYWNRILT